MKKTVFIIALLTITLVGCKQSNNLMQQLVTIDSIAFQKGDSMAYAMLEEIAPETINDEESIAYYWLLKTRTEIRLSKDIKDTVAIDKSINYYLRHTNNAKLARAYGYKAHILKANKDLRGASVCLKYAEQLVKNDSKELALTYMIYYSLAEINYKAKEHQLAIDYEKKALKTAYTLNNSSNIAKVSHLPFYRLSRIIKHCNILIDNLLTSRK